MNTDGQTSLSVSLTCIMWFEPSWALFPAGRLKKEKHGGADVGEVSVHRPETVLKVLLLATVMLLQSSSTALVYGGIL